MLDAAISDTPKIVRIVFRISFFPDYPLAGQVPRPLASMDGDMVTNDADRRSSCGERVFDREDFLIRFSAHRADGSGLMPPAGGRVA
jgi:hypothetical protein